MNRNPTIAVKYALILLMVAIVARGAIGVYNAGVERKQVRAAMTKIRDESPIIAVHITGAVKEPGIYTLTKGARLCDAIEAAGGLLADAVSNRMNLASTLKDGQKIIVRSTLPETASSEIEGADEDASSTRSEARGPKPLPKGPVNINTATGGQLQTIPGVGPSTAQKIIELRNSRGPFSVIDEIKLVKGIGDGKFEKMKSFIVVK